jgi:hypothetical protein
VSKRPSIQFYPGDWQRDSALRSCSLAARGLWIEMLCLMHDSKPYGHLKIGERNITTELLAMMVGADPNSVTASLAELEQSGVFSKTRDGVIYSRRLVKDDKLRTVRRGTGSLGGNPKLTGGYKQAGHVYCVLRESDGAVKIGASASPQKRLYVLRQKQYGEELELVLQAPVENMGEAEARVHKALKEYQLEGEWFLAPVEKVKEAFLLIHSVADEDEEEDLDILFETLWSKYPKPLGKKEARRHFDASVKTPEDVAAISVALQNYRVHLANNSTDERFIKHGSTWFNNWREWVNYAPRPTAADGLPSDSAEAEVYSAIERFRQIRGPRPDDGPARQEWDGLFADEMGFTPTEWIERTPEQIAAWRDRLTVTQ